MFSYIVGKIALITPSYIVVDNNGVGYEVVTANPYLFKLGETTKVYIYQHVREDINTLYGFISFDDKKLFLKLISVSGIGPKTALSIVAGGNADEVFYAIETGNYKMLMKYPGIGQKTAQQIILDLKGKLDKTENHFLSPKEDELVQLLQALGYNKKEIMKVIPSIGSFNDIGQAVKDALRLLSK